MFKALFFILISNASSFFEKRKRTQALPGSNLLGIHHGFIFLKKGKKKHNMPGI
jgi:hypothetical protein